MDNKEIVDINMVHFIFDTIQRIISIKEPQCIAFLTETCFKHDGCGRPHTHAIGGSKFLVYKMMKEAVDDMRRDIMTGDSINDKLALEIYEGEDKNG